MTQNTFELLFLKMLKTVREELKHDIRIHFVVGL